MTTSQPSPEAEEAFWRDFLTRGAGRERLGRRVFRHIPHEPRCKLCAAPFGGMGAPVMRLLGKRPSDKNPTMCASCFAFMSRHHGGAEIECTLLFADIRGSTAMAEQTSATGFRDVIDRFYAVATTVVFDHDGASTSSSGTSLWPRSFLVDGRCTRPWIDAARALLTATGHADRDGPWLPIGAGVNTGPTWVGAVGDAAHRELTVLGDSVNTTARLASVAEAGEILVTIQSAQAAGLANSLELRSLQLKGKNEPTDVVVLRVEPPSGV
jgi:adenylate cyclase